MSYWFPVHEGNDDVSMPWPDAFINHQDVVIKNLCPFHRIAFDRKEEGRNGIAHQVFIDIGAPVLVIRRRTRKPGRHPDLAQRQGKFWRPEEWNEDAQTLGH